MMVLLDLAMTEVGGVGDDFGELVDGDGDGDSQRTSELQRFFSGDDETAGSSGDHSGSLSFWRRRAVTLLKMLSNALKRCPSVGISAGDAVMVGRYILERIAEISGVVVSFDPKPIPRDWNGFGAHKNYRNGGGIDVIKKTIEKLKLRHKEHIAAMVRAMNAVSLDG
ncbi:hypothetical protein DM860_012314 [Cuscuta australis]|uniref:Uncharacterized protein n=1 Tax=Cuscuta australis TaxID=267555 RepID=A0A328DTH3_9ASTE|nr:hypothetical protein DM860_012314 [Cuscuta australis]